MEGNELDAGNKHACRCQAAERGGAGWSGCAWGGGGGYVMAEGWHMCSAKRQLQAPRAA